MAGGTRRRSRVLRVLCSLTLAAAAVIVSPAPRHHDGLPPSSMRLPCCSPHWPQIDVDSPQNKAQPGSRHRAARHPHEPATARTHGWHRPRVRLRVVDACCAPGGGWLGLPAGACCNLLWGPRSAPAHAPGPASSWDTRRPRQCVVAPAAPPAAPRDRPFCSPWPACHLRACAMGARMLRAAVLLDD